MRQAALSMKSAAMVVDVLALLEFGGHREIVMRTGHHAPKCKLVFSVFSPVVPVDCGLDSFE
jgi:hypothetical protein